MFRDRKQTLCVSSLLWYLLAVLLLSTACGLPWESVQPATTPSTALNCTQRSSTPVTLSMYYGSEKENWMRDVIADFNQRGLKACDGPISVQAVPIGSGASMQQILAGSIKPDVWSPAGSTWLNLLNDQWRKQHSSDIIDGGANATPPLVNSPVVIAMWKPQAEALGWPQRSIGWSDIAKLSTDPRGWASYGHPEWGDFKFGHTHPDYSNSGLDAVIAENYAALNKRGALSAADIEQARTKDFVANVESSVIHYGDSTGFFADKMFKGGPNYLSAAVMYESLVVEANQEQTYGHLPYPVVAIYPKEGTFYSDHPFSVLQAGWVTPAKKAAAQVLRDFLLDKAQQQKALSYGFRPAKLDVPIAAPLDSQHGVDPKQPQSVLQVPSVSIVNAIKASWNQQKRKVDVMLILDRSGSMNDSIGGSSKIEAAKQGLSDFVNLLGDSDGLGVTVFSNDAQTLTPVDALGSKRQNVLEQIKGIQAGGSTRLYNTIDEQVEALQKQASRHIKAVIVLTDGQDTVQQMNLQELLSKIKPTSDDRNAGNRVKVFTIAYGNPQDIDENALKQIAEAGGGQEYAGTPQNIRQVYNQISEFF
ncbi:MAG TPA: VWA domain-containing protein [Ktedonobacteraceae bacterium]|nr:VWA domain-containing protein [Ktedonobacteraceae bacterium]